MQQLPFKSQHLLLYISMMLNTTLPERYHISHTVYLLIGKAHTPLLLTLSLLLAEHILCKGSG